MGLQIGEIIPKKQIEFSDLKGKVVAVDAFNDGISSFSYFVKPYIVNYSGNKVFIEAKPVDPIMQNN